MSRFEHWPNLPTQSAITELKKKKLHIFFIFFYWFLFVVYFEINFCVCLFSVSFLFGSFRSKPLMYLSISSALKSILFSFHVCLHEISSANQLRHSIAHVCNPTVSTFICLGLLIPICFLQSVPLLTFAKIQANSTNATPVKPAFFFFLQLQTISVFLLFSLSLLITDMQTPKMLIGKELP